MGAKPSGQSAAGAGSEDGSRALGRIRGNHLPGPVGQYLVERGLHVSQVVDLLEAVRPVTRRVVRPREGQRPAIRGDHARQGKIGRADVWTPVTQGSRMPASARKKKKSTRL